MGFVHQKVGVETAEWGIDSLKGAQPPATNGALREHVERVAIDLEANVIGQIRVLAGADGREAGSDVAAADPSDGNQRNHQKGCHHKSGAAGSSFAEQEAQKNGNLHGKGNHASTRAGEENGCAHECGGGSRGPAFLAASVTAEGEYQRDGRQHFHESRIVVVVYVGTVDPAAEAR